MGLNASWAGELWRYRELFYFLAWRDVKVRYKQTILGVVWAVLQPLLTMVVFMVLFGKIAQISTGETPPALFYYIGHDFQARCLRANSQSISMPKPGLSFM